jgi:hypothetical protein
MKISPAEGNFKEGGRAVKPLTIEGLENPYRLC